MTMDHDPGGGSSSSGSSSSGDKYALHLPPPPPAGATLPPSVKEQRERVREAIEEGQTLRVGEVFYPTSLRWWQQWKVFVGYEEGDSSAEADEDLHPGPINNSALAMKQPRKQQQQQQVLELRKGLSQYQDYEFLPEPGYTLLKEWYGGGPDLPRSVVRVGKGGNAFNHIELYPYVVDVACGDSVFHCGTSKERRGGQQQQQQPLQQQQQPLQQQQQPLQQQQRLVLSVETPAGEFVKEVCKAGGVEVEHAELYLVVLSEDEEGREVEMVDGMEGVTMGTGEVSGNPQQDQEGGGVGSNSSSSSSSSKMDMDTDASLVPPPLQSVQQQQQQQQQQQSPEMKKLEKGGFAVDETVADLLHGQTGVRVFVEDRSWRLKLKVGDAVDAMDDSSEWYDCVVVQVLEPEKIVSSSSSSSSSGGGGKGAPRVQVHFRCWEDRWDLIKEVTCEHIQPLFTKAVDWRHFTLDMFVELRCKGDQKWYKATIVHINEAARMVKVQHLPNENNGASVWEKFDSENISRLGVHLKEKGSSPTGAGASSSSGSSSGGLSPSNSSSLNSSTSSAKSPSSSSSSSSTGASAFPAAGGRTLGTGAGAGAAAGGGGGGITLGGSGSGSSYLLKGSSSGYGGGRGGGIGSSSSSSPGVVGLSNLGNTCFMNSMLQCLSNTGMLTDFFLSGKHEGQINEDNPLGKQGVLARTYARLLTEMWEGERSGSAIYPTEFKKVISQYAPQFAGYQQHDSQELMNFLLDGLHEDLNRVRQKPYVATRDYAGEPDGQFAGECWKRHLARNDSVVIDHCQGQYKSHLTCPKCAHESITFDPYMSLTLPLPVTCMVKVAFVFHSWPLGKSPPLSVAANLPSTATAKHLKAWIVENLCCPPPPSPPPLPPSSPLALASKKKEEEMPESMLVEEEEEEEEEMPKQQKFKQARGESTEEGGVDSSSRSAENAMAVVEEKGEEEEAFRKPSPFTINLVEIFDRRQIKEFKDNDPISELARTTITLQAFQLEHTPSPLPPPRITTTSSSSSSSSWQPGGGKRDSSRSPPRFGVRSKTPPPSFPPSASSALKIEKKEQGREDGKEEEVFVMATCLFGKARPSTFSFATAFKTYERFGPSVCFTLSSTRATNRGVHARVWAATQRFLKEEGGREGGREEEEEGEEGMKVPYRVYVAKLGGEGAGEEVPDDGGMFDVQVLREKKVLLVAFENAVYGERVAKEEVERKELHSSVRWVGGTQGGKAGVGGKNVIELKQCLEKFSEREQLEATDPWFCPKCKEHVSAFKKMDVWSLPDVLILHLKRFSYVQGLYSGPTREKIEDLVHFPVEGLDMRDVMRGPVDEAAPPVYDLYAVSEHSGGLGGGHYTAVAKNFRDGKWYSFNDSYVKPVEEGREEAALITPRAYVLFYKRRQGSLKWAGARLPAAVEEEEEGEKMGVVGRE